MPCRKQGKSGTLPSIFSQGATYRIGVGDGSYSLVVARCMGPVAGNFSSSKVLKKAKTGFYVIRATRPAGMFGGPSVVRAQKALEEQLRTRMPRVLQGHSSGVIQAERVGLENHATILMQYR